MSKTEKKPKDRGDTFSEHVSLARDPPPQKNEKMLTKINKKP